MFRQLMLAALPLLAASASLSSCGSNSDHLSGVTISVSPDPIEKDATFTIHFDGTLDKDLSTLNADVDLDVSVLGLITENVKAAGKLVIDPVVPKGPIHLTIGPVKLTTSIPGSVDVSGKVQLRDENEEAVACLQLDMKVPLSQQQELESAVESCGTSADHAKNFAFSTSGDVTTISGDLDESLSQFSVAVDMTIKELFVKIPVSISTPITYTPGFPSGPFKMVATSASSSELTAPELSVAVTGTAKMNDANNEEVGCISFSQDAAKALIV